MERRGVDRARERADARADGDRKQLQPVDGHPHQLRRERIVTVGAPGAAGPRLVQEVNRGEHDDDGDQREPEVRAVRRQVVAEDPEVVDVRDPVRPARDVVRSVERDQRHAISLDRDRVEDLAEEQRYDREVVADEPARRQREQESDEDRRAEDERQRLPERPVHAELRRGEQCVSVRAEAVERDVPEVEQSRESDGDVETEREQCIDQRDDADAQDVLVRRHHGNERDQRNDDGEGAVADRRRRLLRPGSRASRSAALCRPRHPFVGADLRPGRRIGHQTFWRAGVPNKPVGRTSMTTTRTAKTITSWYAEDR